jgi:hypothetical protein
MSAGRFGLERTPEPPWNPVGEGYRYFLLTVITIAVLFTSTVLVLGAAGRRRTSGRVSSASVCGTPSSPAQGSTVELRTL